MPSNEIQQLYELLMTDPPFAARRRAEAKTTHDRVSVELAVSDWRNDIRIQIANLRYRGTPK